MIITLTKANFSASNIGTLSSLAILTNLDSGLVYSGPLMVNSGESLSATITPKQDYKILTNTVSISMGGVAVSNGISITERGISINIATVTGIILITAKSEFDVLNAGLELILGYANGSKVVDNELQNRVRTKYLYGNYKLTVNPDYRIRMVVSNMDEGGQAGDIYSTTSTTLTTITVNNPGKYSIITFAHADANKSISPKDDIVATYEPMNYTWIEGEALTTTLAQGYVVSSPTPTSNSTNTTRVRTAVIQGPFRVTANDGFIIRGVSTSTNPDGYTDGADVLKNMALTSYDCTNDCLGYSVVTFADAADATNNISPSSNIIKSLNKMEIVRE